MAARGNIDAAQLKNYPADATLFLDGTGAWTAPATNAGTVPTTGWSGVNGIVYNDYNVPQNIAAWIIDNASLNWRLVKRTLISSTYTVIATVNCTGVEGHNSQTFGLYLSDGTKLIGFEILAQAGAADRLRVERMNSVTSDNSTVAGATSNLVPFTMTLKIENDGVNRTFSYFTAGSWTQFYQEAFNAFLVETEVAFGGLSATASSGIGIQVGLTQYSET